MSHMFIYKSKFKLLFFIYIEKQSEYFLLLKYNSVRKWSLLNNLKLLKEIFRISYFQKAEIGISSVRCRGSEVRLADCAQTKGIDCVSNQYASVVCSRLPPQPGGCFVGGDINYSEIVFIRWTQSFVVWRWWTCSWTLEFVDFRLYAT